MQIERERIGLSAAGESRILPPLHRYPSGHGASPNVRLLLLGTMAISRHRAVAAWVVVLAAALGAGCSNPNSAEGGFLGGDGGVCPEAFRGATDGPCRKGPPPACQDAAPHIQPLCAL